MKTMKTLWALIVLGPMACLIAGCPRKSAAPGGPANIKVAYLPIADCLQLYVAVDRGYLAKEGLKAEIVPLQSGPKVIEALLSKSADVGISNVVSTIIAHSKGVPVVAFTGGPVEAATHRTHALLVPATSSTKRPQDLVGKTVAVNALRNIEHVMLREYLEKNGLQPDSVKVVEAPFPQMEGILKSGSVDAIMAIEPFVTLAESHKTVRVLGHPYTDVHPKRIVSIYDVRSDWLAEHPDQARKFSAAMADATDYIQKDSAGTRAILLKYTKIPAEISSQVSIPEFQARFEPQDVQAWIDELARQGIIPAAFPASEVYKPQ